MKRLIAAVVLSMFAGVLLPGCSDSPRGPVDPAGPSPRMLASVEKPGGISFTFTHSPVSLTGEGEVKLVADKEWKIEKYGVVEQVIALSPSGSGDPLVSGTMVHYLSATFDAVTGEGPVHGRFTFTPMSDVGGGVWEGTYEGYRSKTDAPNVFTLPLKAVAHGRGGTIQGMQLREETLITAYDTPPTYWTGVGNGSYR